ncbi:hypothetical protein [Nocardia nova]|uniref:hypothetical protein n=1 Tax=Nocardia nova TaxID=37330 RepID=UPI0033E2BEC1
MTGTENSHHFRTEVGPHSAWWRVVRGERVEITHLTDRETLIDTASFVNHRVTRTSRDGVVFADPPTLAVAHFLAPEYHSLWCAVSEQFRRTFTP